MVYTGAMLALGDKNNDIKAADLEDQWELKHLVLSLKDSEREVLLVPAEWQISNVLNLEVMSEKSELGIITAGLGAHDKIPSMNGGDEDESIVLSEPLSVYILHESLRRESGGMNSDKPMKMFKIGQDMSEFFDAVKKFDNSERIKLVTQQVSEFNSFMIFGAALSPGDIMKAIYEVFDNQNIHYVAGNEGTYSDDKRYVLSLSSIIFLEWLGLLPVLKLHSNILISANLKGWLQSLVKAELSSTSVGRLIVVDGKVSMVKESPETRKPTVDRYKRMLVAIDDLPEISVSTIDPKIRQIEKLDVESVQLAIDKKAVLLTEDSAWQTIVHSDFHTFAGMSSMTLIGNEVTIDSTQSKKYPAF